MPKAGQRISEYVLLEKIGEGGFGEVWKARHHLLDDLVAVKIPTDPSYVGELRTEGTLQRALKHPNIVHTIGLDPTAETPYCVMEYVDGTDLRRMLRQRGPVSLQEALEIARPILEALAFAHSQGIVHRDLKPENVLLSAGGDRTRHTVKVTDFGLGKASERVTTSLYLSGHLVSSEGKAIAGTLDYMSPEQRKGCAADARSDLYSFGLVFYEMLTGELPQGAFRYPSEIFRDVPRRVDDFLRRCLAPAPEDRFTGAGEALECFDRLLEPVFAADDSGIAFRKGEPLVLRPGLEVYTLRELVEAMLTNGDDGRQTLYGGSLEAWLRGIREKDLARRAAEIREGEPDVDVGVQKFLDATGMVPPPKMDLDALEMKLGPIQRGASHTFRIYVTRLGRGILWGEARIEGEPSWVHPPRLFFKGAESSVEFTISTAGFPAGQGVDLAVMFESNGGKARVPVHFGVAPRPAQLVCADREADIVCVGRGPGTARVRLRNEGDQPLSLSASWSDDWLSVDHVQDLAPGAEEEVLIHARPRRGGDLPQVGRVSLLSAVGSAEIVVRVTRVKRFNVVSFLLGLVTGIIPFVAEMLIIFLACDVAFRRKGTTDSRDNLSFLFGLMPGVIWHGALLLARHA